MQEGRIMLEGDKLVTEHWTGMEAIDQYNLCLSRAFEDDAIGEVLGWYRSPKDNQCYLEIMGDLEDPRLRPYSDVFEMIIIDSGNSSGDAWKFIFHPFSCSGTFVSETYRDVPWLSSEAGGKDDSKEPPASEEWPEKWSGPLTVGNMIANLQTLPKDMPIHAAYHQIRDGQPSRLVIKHPTVSRERVDGREIKMGDETVPYSAVLWTHERDTA